MKTVLRQFILFALAFGWALPRALACQVCKAEQPAGLENITHGPGPSGWIDYFIMYSASVIVLITLYLSIKYLVKPKEDSPDHAKNIVMDQGF